MPLIFIFLGLVTHSLGVSSVEEPSDCQSQGGFPKCPANEDFLNCKVECPNDYCPVSDTRAIIACDPPYPCPAGCVCKAGYLRKSKKEDYCIEASKCPPVKCTRQNEVWNPSPPNCLRERCEDANEPQEPCDSPYRNYRPQCVCRDGFYRNESDICVPLAECPLACAIPMRCRPTCEVPNPSNCPVAEPTDGPPPVNIDGCQCQRGYILSGPGGKCIRIEECPQNQGCNGDPYAVIKSNPWGCRATCAQPYTRSCSKPFGSAGCECLPGYILSEENGKCIKVEKCPDGDPCAPNATFVDFLNSCPYEYCPREDTRLYPCDPVMPSPAGCACKPEYKRLNSDENKCVLASDCPFVCPISRQCRPTCANPNPQHCYDMMPASLSLTEPTETTGNIDGCQCQKGYILSEEDGKCIKIEECPQNQGCNGDPNAVVKACPWPCPSTCSRPNTVLCYKSCLPVGCQCAPGYILSEETNVCVLPKDCKGGDPCGPNGTFSECSHRCPELYCPKNDDRVQPVCDPIFPCPPGCMCKINHRRLSYEDEKCVLSSECPPVNCTRPNEVWAPCPSDCLAEYCENVNDPPVICNTLLLNCQPKCVCAKGYYRNSTTELCVPASECENYVDPCRSNCTPTCSEPNPSGCYSSDKNSCCPDGYILSARNGTCIKIEDCPRQIGCNGDPNAIVKKCPAPCPSTCDHPEEDPCKKMCLAVGCECAPGYLKSDTDGKCILADECPGGNPCGPNGTYVSCAFRCPNQFCPKDDSRVQIACKPPHNCPPGCACKLNHKRLSYKDDRCIVSTECPPVKCTRPNEVWSPCPIECPVDNCENVNDPPSVCYTLVLNCQPNCVCADGYYRNSSGICVPPKDCKGFNPCLSKCSPTCLEPNPPNCGNLSQYKCCKDGEILTEYNGTCIKIENCPQTSCGKYERYVVDSNECKKTCANYIYSDNAGACKPFTGCVCQPGYVRVNDDATGRCIPESECPTGCNGDPNAIEKKCPNPCPPTCENPNPIGICAKACLLSGCECKPGYLLSNGTCILPKDCPGGETCPPNEQHVNCKVNCPNNYCPVNDNRGILICDPPWPCPSGCICNTGYLRKSKKENYCIEASKCPPVNCTRPNEVWNPSPPNCLRERCEDANKPQEPCDRPYRNYRPQCVCRDGFYRNNSDICIPASECPFVCPISKECRPTCALPNPPNCPAYKPAEKNIDGCQCQEGYILSNSGICIRIDECPRDVGCGGDPNAVVKSYPNPCPSTCEQPDSLNCNKECVALGCECAPGYIKSNSSGKCIQADQCPGGDPCGINATFVQCAFRCPDQYCPPNDGPQPVCMPGPYCRSGCACKLNHKRLNYNNDKCILSSDCPPVNCTRPNEVWSSCPSACLAERCENVNDPPIICNTLVLNCQPQCVCADGYYRNDSGICIPANKCKGFNPCLSKCTPTCVQPNPPHCGCSSQYKCCKSGYILTQRNGTCVRNGCCPTPPKPICGKNEIASDTKIVCPPQTCASKYIMYNCIANIKPEPGCNCIKGYLRNSKGVCIPSEECPPLSTPPQIICGKNEVATNDKIICPPQVCPSPFNIKYACIRNRKPVPGCNCIKGYLRNSKGVCIPSSLCPPRIRPLPKCGLNEVYSIKKIKCPPQTCAGRFALYKCNASAPTEPGCNCINGYLRNDIGVCIPSNKCPPPPLNCGLNEIASNEKIECPPQTCESIYTSYACKPKLPKPGCNCKDKYLRNSSGVCIPSEQCPPPPPVCGENEVATDDKIVCPPQTCESRYTLYKCDSNRKPEPGCNCVSGYLRNSEGVCIPSEQCPPLPKGCNGDPNAVTKRCPNPCQPTCTNPNPPDVCIQACLESGCECLPGYLLSNGTCVLPKDCPVRPLPKCGLNEVYSVKKIKCPPQTCAGRFALYKCNPSAPTEPGCNCINGYLRNDKGVCIPSNKCPPPPLNCGLNEIASNEKIVCPPQTCESIYTSYACKPKLPKPGCNCKDEYLRNSSGVCIPSEQCPPQPKGCNGDPNAVTKRCPNPCQPTCTNPNPPDFCIEICLETGCECLPGYLLSNGTCVLPKDCPGGVVCPANERYVGCKIDCPNNYCPTDDNRGILICDPAFPCPGGCVCQEGYLRKSQKEKSCIKSSKCPPVKCTRPNEVWNPQPPNCIRATCEDRYMGPDDPCYLPYITGGRPQCVCQDGYYRNASDICIPAKDCPFVCPIRPECRPTCAVPNPKNCSTAQPVKSNIDGCQCQDGYILSNSGKCIRIEECPEDQGCNGDPNAVVKQCPGPCPSTCSSPDNSNCKRACASVGCQCAPGYLRSEHDEKCIPANQCPGGDPCAPNATFVDCAFRCPNQYCPQDDSRVQIACKPPRNCPSGCGCKPDYKRLSYEDDRCILSTDCPPVNCTRPNEFWAVCPTPCSERDCKDVNEPPKFCIALAIDCNPQCICESGYFRNSSGYCVPADQCENYNPCLSQCAPTCAEPNPPDCDSLSENKCCPEGYILSDRNGGKCIKIEDCPRNTTCNGDPHAIIKKCPSPNPPTCDNPVSVGTDQKCPPLGCECEPGYIRSTPDGRCIPAIECPGGDPCGPNGTFVPCSFRCPDQNCPKTDDRFQVACMPPYNCPPGCACKSNYLRISSKDDGCILASDCPPVKCTRPNEFWAACPNACSEIDCKNVNEPPRACIALAINCRPRCICESGYYRNSSGYCVRADQCENYNPCLSQCAPTCAEPNPPDCDPYLGNKCCPEGYILSERNGGKCIKIKDCPRNTTCNGDPNAVVKQCPAPCPSTCDSPNAFPCRKACYPVGCECADGYLRADYNGKCIKPEQCPGGYPCEKNEVFVPSKSDCESSFCPKDDSRTPQDCQPGLGLSGCICKVNYRRKSYDDYTCIVASDCPPVNCTRPNEEWSSCPSACLQESCKDVGKKPVVCNTLVLNCQPQCICCKGYYRNSSGICVPPKRCPCN